MARRKAPRIPDALLDQLLAGADRRGAGGDCRLAGEAARALLSAGVLRRAEDLNRKNAPFACSDGGAEHWAVIASLVETAKLNAVEPQGYIADVIARIVAGHPQSQIDDLLPWACATAPLKAVA